jgi:hypothetical protein
VESQRTDLSCSCTTASSSSRAVNAASIWSIKEGTEEEKEGEEDAIVVGNFFPKSEKSVHLLEK